jgi:pimeloyl-ACP methyl ester carboxylesterase
MAQTVTSTRDIPLTRSEPDPAKDYATALAKLAALQEMDGDDINPDCRTYLLTHGQAVERAIVLVHGTTNCPAQYVQLAPLFFERGYNVLVPRMPHDGLRDRDTDELRRLTSQELRTFADTIVDIARGLGEHVTVVGISAGGVVAAWTAQFRPDVARAVVIAPAFGILPNRTRLGRRANWLVMNILSILPNLMTQRYQGPKEGPPHGYNGFATHGLVAVMRLGAAIYRAARRQPPAAHSVTVLMNDNDAAVNNTIIRDLASAWRARGGDRVAFYTLSANMRVIHEMIEPNRPKQRVAVVYPILLKLIAGE